MVDQVIQDVQNELNHLDEGVAESDGQVIGDDVSKDDLGASHHPNGMTSGSVITSGSTYNLSAEVRPLNDFRIRFYIVFGTPLLDSNVEFITPFFQFVKTFFPNPVF